MTKSKAGLPAIGIFAAAVGLLAGTGGGHAAPIEYSTSIGAASFSLGSNSVTCTSANNFGGCATILITYAADTRNVTDFLIGSPGSPIAQGHKNVVGTARLVVTVPDPATGNVTYYRARIAQPQIYASVDNLNKGVGFSSNFSPTYPAGIYNNDALATYDMKSDIGLSGFDTFCPVLSVCQSGPVIGTNAGNFTVEYPFIPSTLNHYQAVLGAKKGGIYSFNGNNGDTPLGAIAIDATTGNMYGTTSQGGFFSHGVIFQLTPPPAGSNVWSRVTLHQFTGARDGSTPMTGLTLGPDGSIYGTAYEGGHDDGRAPHCIFPAGCGVVFRLAPAPGTPGGWAYHVIHEFRGGTDGALPEGQLTFGPDGALYGTTLSGGHFNSCSLPASIPDTGCGLVFRLAPRSADLSVWDETVLHAFGGALDGGYPKAGVTFGPDGSVYGTASAGGVTSAACANPDTGNGCGIVFRLTPTATPTDPWKTSVVHSFQGGADGSVPNSRLVIDAAGVIYGTAFDGGHPCHDQGLPACGVVFRLTHNVGAPGWKYDVLHAFGTGVANDGFGPNGNLVLDASHGTTLYGATRFGPGCTRAPFCGELYKLTAPAGGAAPWTQKILHAFAGQGDGATPIGGIVRAPSGKLVALTSEGGNADVGAVAVFSR